MDLMSTTAALVDAARRWDSLLDPWTLLVTPFYELARVGWRGVVLPPIVSGGMVSLTLNSLEIGLVFALVMIPFAAFFYWVISNLRRLRRTAHEINNTLQVIVGKDPAAMRRLQDAHRERLTRAARPR